MKENHLNERSVREIDEERRQSGWNPYQGEEEFEETDLQQEMPVSEGEELEGIKTAERDLRMLQSMFPQAIKMLLPYVEEVCDRMEYQGSMMYDSYPDKETVLRMADEIFSKVEGQFPQQSSQNVIRVLLLQEMHHRRCRFRECRKNLFN